jgi:hypothetical protein
MGSSKDSMNDLEENCKKKNITDSHGGINEHKKGYRPTINLVKDGTGFLLAVSQIVWKGGSITSASYLLYVCTWGYVC